MLKGIFRNMVNYVIVSSAAAWLAAQIIKTAIHAVKNGMNFERLVGAGGMPSSHTAMVIATLISIARIEGTASPLFGLAAVVSAVVIYDAMNVRHAAGLHARELNTINRLFNFRINEENSGKVTMKDLNEFLGHTPLEVIGGAVVGVAVGLLIPIK